MKPQQHKLLLIRLFDRLRTELSIPLGIGEYQLLLEALENGLSFENAGSLLSLCETIWIKSQEDQEILTAMLKQLIEEEIQIIETIAKNEERAAQRKREDLKRKEKEKHKKEEKKPPKKNEAKNNEEAPPKEEVPKKTNTQRVKEEQEVGIVLDLPIDEHQEKISPQNQDAFVLSDDYLPISSREMKQLWRMLRSRTKSGTSAEIDIPETVQAISKEGIIIDPIYQSDRINSTKLIIMVDHHKGMIAFHTLTQNLVQSAIVGGGHKDASIFYFNQYPGPHLFTNATHTKHQALSHVLAQISSPNTVALIVSDAGAASGEYDSERIGKTLQSLKELKNHVSRVVWLNPMPRHRWSGTSAYMISKSVDMFEFIQEQPMEQSENNREQIDHKKGMKQVISLLQGKTT